MLVKKTCMQKYVLKSIIYIVKSAMGCNGSHYSWFQSRFKGHGFSTFRYLLCSGGKGLLSNKNKEN